MCLGTHWSVQYPETNDPHSRHKGKVGWQVVRIDDQNPSSLVPDVAILHAIFSAIFKLLEATCLFWCVFVLLYLWRWIDTLQKAVPLVKFPKFDTVDWESLLAQKLILDLVALDSCLHFFPLDLQDFFYGNLSERWFVLLVQVLHHDQWVYDQYQGLHVLCTSCRFEKGP